MLFVSLNKIFCSLQLDFAKTVGFDGEMPDLVEKKSRFGKQI